KYGDIAFYSWRPSERVRWLEKQGPILEHDPILEPGETALDSVRFEAPRNDWTAIEVEVRIARNKKGNRFYKRVINLKGLDGDNEDESSEKSTLALDLARQEGPIPKLLRRLGL
ncbi:MAG: hypothetical protein WKF28_11055, partial [Rubrobacteraceae bacterium]